MVTLDMREAEARFTQLIDDVGSGREEEIIIRREGQPSVKIVAVEARSNRIGVAEGKFSFDYELDKEADREIQKLFDDSAAESIRRGFI